MQLAALAAPEKLPARQSTHRSGAELLVSASYVPGLHGCFESQYGWLALSWYFPTGQPSQLGEFAAPEYVPGAHAVQVLPLTKVPGLHVAQ
jgi:hypothetical protein